MSSRNQKSLGWLLWLAATGRMAGDAARWLPRARSCKPTWDAQALVSGSCEMMWGPTKQGFDELSFNYMNCFCVMRAQGKIAWSWL